MDNTVIREAEINELLERIESCDSVSNLDKLRMDVVAIKDRKILELWQEKYWERKKTYTFDEVQAFRHQAELRGRIDEAQQMEGYLWEMVDEPIILDIQRKRIAELTKQLEGLNPTNSCKLDSCDCILGDGACEEHEDKIKPIRGYVEDYGPETTK